MKTTIELWNDFRKPYCELYDKFILILIKLINKILIWILRKMDKDYPGGKR